MKVWLIFQTVVRVAESAGNTDLNKDFADKNYMKN